MKTLRVIANCLHLVAACAGSALAQELPANESQAAVDAPALPRDWSAYWETVVHHDRSNGGVDAPAPGGYSALDLRFDRALAPAWRAMFADRLVFRTRSAGQPADGWQNRVREASLAYSRDPSLILDVGRINTRFGVAYGYNPTDHFAAGSSRDAGSLAPSEVRASRIGAPMARAQTFWAEGSFTGLLARPTGSGADPSARSTRWLLAATQRLGEGFSPELILTGDSTERWPSVGLNATTLLGPAVGYVEWSGQRRCSFASSAFDTCTNAAFVASYSVGLSYSGLGRSLWVLEYEHEGAAPDRSEWNALRQGAPLGAARYLDFVDRLQRLPTRQQVFAHVVSRDTMFPSLDLSAWARWDLADHSSLYWAEARYRWLSAEAALQVLHGDGDANTVFGALPQRTRWQAVFKYFF